jgi:hypothetical protein
MAEDLFRLGADAEVGVGLGEEHGSVAIDDVSCGQDEFPALVAVDEGQIHENAAIVLLVERRNGVGESELLADFASLVE